MRPLNFKNLIFDALCFSFLASLFIFFVLSPTEKDLLELGINSTGFFFLTSLGCLISYLMSVFKIRTLGEVLFLSHNKANVIVPQKWYLEFWRWQAMATITGLLVAGLISTEFSVLDLLDKEGFAGAVRLINGIGHPNFEILPRAVINIFETIFMAFIATLLALPFAFVLGFLMAKNIMKGKIAFQIYWILRLIFNIIRSIEALIWAIIFSVWVGIGPFAGMLALMIHSVASLAKQYSEIIESVDNGPLEGILATGARTMQVIWFAVVPQVLLPFISFTVYRWDINVRMATIIGLVGGGGIGTMLIQYQGQAMWNEVGCIIFVIAIAVWLLDQTSTLIRDALK